jgi:hypothetical protein
MALLPLDYRHHTVRKIWKFTWIKFYDLEWKHSGGESVMHTLSIQEHRYKNGNLHTHRHTHMPKETHTHTKTQTHTHTQT